MTSPRKSIILSAFIALSACSSTPELPLYETPAQHTIGTVQGLTYIAGTLAILALGLNFYFSREFDEGSPGYIRARLLGGIVVLAIVVSLITHVLTWLST
jgi:hypothetical protein